MADRKAYKTDVSDAQWDRMLPLIKQFDPEFNKGPKRSADLREIYNAIEYQQRTGCQWDMLPHDLPPKSTVWDTYKRWRDHRVMPQVNEALVTQVRLASVQPDGRPREAKPSAAAIDSQTVKSTQACEDRGFDGGKRITGRKRHVAVDMLGLLLAVYVSVASVDDATGAEFLVDQLERPVQPRLKVVYADGKYHNHALKAYMQGSDIGWRIEVIKRPPGSVGFVSLPKRWVVERTFAWTDRYRRMSKDYERTAESAEMRVWLCSISRMLKLLDPPAEVIPFKYRPSVDQTIASNLAA